MEMSRFEWSWQEFCGSDSFRIWTSNHEDLSLCFQLLCLQIPVLSVIAIISAYYAGKHFEALFRTPREKRILKFRMCVVLLLACKPVVETIVLVCNSSKYLHVIDYGLAALASFSWFVHFGYVSAMRCDTTTSLRGPMKLVSLWVMLFVTSIIHTRSMYLKFRNDASLDATTSLFSAYIAIFLQILYGFSLSFSDDSDSRRSTLGAPDQEDVMRSSGYVRFRDDFDQKDLGVAMKDSGFLSKLFFNWVNRLIEKGSRNQVHHSDDVYDLPEELLGPIHIPSYDDPSLSGMLRREFAVEFYSIGILKLISDLAILAIPLLLIELLNFMEDARIPIGQGYLYTGGILLAFTIGSFCAAHFDFLMGKLSMKCRSSSIMLINTRILELDSSDGKKQLSQYVSREMNADVESIANLWSGTHKLWSLSLQLGITLYLLYLQVGVASFCSVLCSIPLIPVSKIVDKNTGKFREWMMVERDKRIALTSQFIRNILCIKLNRLEDYFVSRIQGLRAEEVKYLKYQKFLRALSTYFWVTSPVLISTLTFMVFLYMGGTLNAVVVSTSLLLLIMLQKTLNEFPIQLVNVIDARTRMRRLEEFLQILHSATCQDRYKEESVSTEWQTMDWSFTKDFLSDVPEEVVASQSEQTSTADYRVDVSIRKGQLVGIIGPASSGKSYLLNSLFEYLLKAQHRVGYVSQIPWIQTSSVRDNITFGLSYDEDRFTSVITACALVEDIGSWAKGEYEMLGESGRTLSDSQKAKIALARAVYADTEFYFLDDFLSSLDQELSRHLFEECVVKLLAGKTRIMVFGRCKVTRFLDWLIEMNGCRIVKQGPVEDFPLCELNLCIGSIDREASLSPSNVETANATQESNRTTDEVKLSACCKFCKSFGCGFALFILLSAIGLQISRIALDWWLSLNVSVQTDHEVNRTDPFYLTEFERALLGNATRDGSSYQHFLTVFMAIGTINAAMAIVLSFMIAYGGTRSAFRIHTELLRTIAHAKMKYFYSMPADKILERFTTDLYLVDNELPHYFSSRLLAYTRLLGVLAIILYGIPWLCLFVIPLVPVCLRLQNRYRITFRSLKRIFNTCHSHLYSYANETVSGLTTIRALRGSFIRELVLSSKVDSLHECQLATIASRAWLNVRLHLISISVIGTACAVSLLQRNFDVVHVGFIGLTMTYALTLHSQLEDLFKEIEDETAAIERINELVQNITPEDPGTKVPYSSLWLKLGDISFEGVFLRYRRDLPCPLRSVTLQIRRGEKIGIVGRSGAGKSSLLLSLFKLVKVCLGGEIVIDGVAIRTGVLRKLRSRMTLLREDTFVFAGSVYDNIDPLGLLQGWGETAQGEKATRILTNAGFQQYIEALGGMQRWILDEDPSLSPYERQLIGLLRAISKYLKEDSAIVCIDVEDTNMDPELKKLVRNMMKSFFNRKTVLMAARDPRTVLDCDKVLVLDEGTVVEFDSPQSLLENERSHFYKMVHHNQ